jgi:hypothetical protein
MKRLRMIAVAAAMFSPMTGTLAHAQWPTDPAAPLVVADRTGPQVQPKIGNAPGGGFYLSWFDSSTGGYDVALQRLDVEGNEMWPHDGVLVADRSFSSTQDYGLSTDTAGNALLAFRDDRGPTTEITVSRVGPDGSLLWGTNGVQVSTGGLFVAAPRVAGTSDGNVVVAWTVELTPGVTSVMVQKLDPSGAAMWGAGLTFTPAAGSFSAADLQASDAGTAILGFIHPTGSFGSPIHLWAQKLAAVDGASLWGAGHVQVYDQAGGSLQFGNFPPLVTDGAGGAVFAWYTNSPLLQCRVQRILANGIEAFAHQGVEVSTDATRVRVSPNAAFNPATQEIFVAWREQNIGQSQSALYAQKLSAAGVRQWTDNGRELMPVSGDVISDIATLALGDGALVAWIHSPTFGNDPVYAIRVDSNGDFSWLPPIAELCILPTESADLVGVMGAEGFAAYAWSDGGFSSGDIYAANLNGDGSLGYLGSVFSDGFESGTTGGWTVTVP